MARFKMDDAEHYGGNGGGGFFSLKNDKDVARVRFLYESVDEVEGIAVHDVDINGKKRWVNCLRNYNEPTDKCPFCREHKPQRAKIFIPVYNVDEDQVQIWERGKTMFAKLSSVFGRYSKKPIVAQEFEIERNGKPQDQTTTYEIYRTDTPADDMSVEDFEQVNILGGFVLDKSADDMEYYLENGQFPPEDDEPDEIPRRGSHRQTRRTPASSREDDF